MGQSTRQGGVSPPPFTSLNLGWHTEDARENVIENRRRLAQSLGLQPQQLSGGHQVHGALVSHKITATEEEGYDAFICQQPGLILSITVADCVPVLIYDPVQDAWAGAHSGWRGTVAGVVAHTLAALETHFGTQPSDCWAYIGASISYDHFVVGPEVAHQFSPRFVRSGQAHFTIWWISRQPTLRTDRGGPCR
ncbi:MAG: laccase domain-containing protein [Lewinella sp.]|nr:laccase domain-containing protein [Lewinella sp.]